MSDELVKLQCPTCDRGLKIQKAKISKSIVCPKCNARFKLDAQTRSVKIEDGNELFGPPISDSFSAGLFEEDIDHLLAEKNKKNTPTAESSPQTRTRKTLNYGVERQVPANDKPVTDRSVQEAWQKEKRVTTKFEESLQRNGIGLLVLATGLAALPFIAGHVDALAAVMNYVPIAAVCLAFVASFMIAHSMRRANIAAIMVSGIPFLLIGCLSLGAYFYAKTYVQSKSKENAEAAKLEVVPADQTNEPDDLFTIDKNSVDRNPASSFVPKQPPRPKAVEKDAEDPFVQNNKLKEPDSGVAVSDLRPNQPIVPVPEFTRDDEPSNTEKELRAAAQTARNTDKMDVLASRLRNHLKKGLVSNSQIKSPSDLVSEYQLGFVAGRQTVYGIASYHRDPITGLDVAHRKNSVDDLFDMFVPIVDEPEFHNSIANQEGAHFVGLNVHCSDQGIIGVQGVFVSASDNATKLSSWVGRAPNDDSFAELRSEDGAVYGFVIYRDKLSAVGIQLIEKK